MTPDQVRGFVMDALSSHPPREVAVEAKDATYIGEVHFAGTNKFRLDAPLGCLFFEYAEVHGVEFR